MCVCVCVCVYPGWLPMLGGQSVPEGSRNSISCLCLTADLKVICVHDLLKTVRNSVSNVQIGFISSELLRYSLFGITRFGSFQFMTVACKHL